MSEISVIMEADSRAPYDSVIIDGDVAEKVASSIERNPLWSHGFSPSPQSCIFTVPESLSRHNEVAYKPTTFSLGPLHYSDEHLKHSQTIKFHYLRDLVERVGVQVKELTTAVAEMETEARKHYGEKIDFSSPEFVEIMIIDGCFIIEFLRKLAGLVPVEPNDPVFGINNILNELRKDLILLENQIPWMILDRLFNMTMGGKEPNPESSLLHIALHFLKNYVLSIFEISPVEDILKLKVKNCQHILGLARSVLLHSTSGFPTNFYQKWESIPSAAELENLGITLKKSESKGLTFSFKDGVMEISPLRIYGESESFLRNMIALEQCSKKYSTFVSSYVTMLEQLIKTAKDINSLSSNDIIKVNLNHDTIGMFNKLAMGVSAREWFYPNIGPPLNAYRRHRWPKWRAMLYRNYFSNPWVIISTFVAFVLLVLTSLQTIYTMKG